MIEQAPKFKQSASAMNLMIELQNIGLLKNIQDSYLYWDKVKYKSKDYEPE
jgi:hypothetical protein